MLERGEHPGTALASAFENKESSGSYVESTCQVRQSKPLWRTVFHDRTRGLKLYVLYTCTCFSIQPNAGLLYLFIFLNVRLRWCEGEHVLWVRKSGQLVVSRALSRRSLGLAPPSAARPVLPPRRAPGLFQLVLLPARLPGCVLPLSDVLSRAKHPTRRRPGVQSAWRLVLPGRTRLPTRAVACDPPANFQRTLPHRIAFASAYFTQNKRVALTGRDTTGPPSRAAPLVNDVASWSVTDDRRLQTPATITSLPPHYV